MQKTKQILSGLLTHVGKYLIWFIVVAVMLFAIDGAFTLMNTDSTILFVTGTGLLVAVISSTIFIIHQLKTKKESK
jgi:hypothetical protein